MLSQRLTLLLALMTLSACGPTKPAEDPASEDGTDTSGEDTVDQEGGSDPDDPLTDSDIE